MRAPLPTTLLTLAATLLALPAAPRAQGTSPRPVVDPVPFEWARTRIDTGFPFGYPDRRVLRYQQIHDGLAGTPRTVQGIAWRRAPNDIAPVPAFTAVVEMRFSTAPHPAAAVDARFAANVGADETVVTPQRTVSFPATSGPWSGETAPFDYQLPADVPFAFGGGGPLCVELRVADHQNRVPTRFALHAEGYPHLAGFGDGCGNLALTTGLAGTEAVHRLGGLPANAPAVLLFGQDFRQSAAGALPLDLEPYGAPGCSLGVAPLFDLRGRADSSGVLETRVPIDGVPPGVWYGVQGAAVLPGVNALGVVTSNTAVVLPQAGRTVGRVWAEDLSLATGQRQPVFGLVLQILE